MDVEEIRPRRQLVTDHELAVAVYRLTPAGSSEVAELVGISRQAAANRLEKLAEKEIVWTKKVGPTRIWMHRTVMPQPGHAGPGTDVEVSTPDAEDAEVHPTAAARKRTAEQQGKADVLRGELIEDRHREMRRDIDREQSPR